jgi:SAM-dependent methyltransferase
MSQVHYDDIAAGAYRRGRTLPPEVLVPWGEALAGLGLPAGRRILDLGAGPGQFAGPLQRWLGGPVVAVEPAPAMRDQARAGGATAEAAYVGAAAEHLPLADATVGVAWLSASLHHFGDRAAAFAELRRVVQPDGCVLVRGLFADQEPTGVFAVFPGIERSVARFPDTTAVAADLAAAGFRPRTPLEVVEPWAWPLADLVARLRQMRSVDNALMPLTDEEFEAGVAAVTDRWAGHDGPVPGPTTLRLLVADA